MNGVPDKKSRKAVGKLSFGYCKGKKSTRKIRAWILEGRKLLNVKKIFI
jgi:hypothetical protein